MDKQEKEKLKYMTVNVKLMLPIWCLQLDKHTLRLLHHYCENRSQMPSFLNKMNENDFLNIRGIGRKSVSEIMELRKQYNQKVQEGWTQ